MKETTKTNLIGGSLFVALVVGSFAVLGALANEHFKARERFKARCEREGNTVIVDQYGDVTCALKSK